MHVAIALAFMVPEMCALCSKIATGRNDNASRLFSQKVLSAIIPVLSNFFFSPQSRTFFLTLQKSLKDIFGII